MIELVCPSSELAALRSSLFDEAMEKCCVLLAARSTRSDATFRLLCREVVYPQPDEYVLQSVSNATLSPHFVARVSKRARQEGLSLVFVHTHPFERTPSFSSLDDDGELVLATFLEMRQPGVPHVALVIGRESLRARELSRNLPVRVIAIGTNRDVLFDPRSSVDTTEDELHDRQIRAFGKSAQKALSSLRVAIVGLGGTGSLISQHLVHLGVSDFILVDPDVVEATNLNRIPHATSTDIGTPKINVAKRYIESFNSQSNVDLVFGDVTYAQVARRLIDADVIFGCTDSHGSRSVIQQVAYQHYVPCIDMGSTISARDGNVVGIFGRIQMLSPGYACFTCGGLLDPHQVRRDLMSPLERKTDPYIPGAAEPAPAVISINGTVSSLAVTMLLAIVAGVPGDARHLIYDGIRPSVRSVYASKQAGCHVCSSSGFLGRGDSVPLAARLD
jgi:molybdopterin-synthase adenylyltransferase